MRSRVARFWRIHADDKTIGMRRAGTLWCWGVTDQCGLMLTSGSTLRIYMGCESAYATRTLESVPGGAMERRSIFSTAMLWLMCVPLWLGGCSAYDAANLASRPAPAFEPTPASSAAGHVTLASWYGPRFIGQRTASGEVYHRDDLTAASRSLPLGTRVQVANLDSGRAVLVRINDRGPYVRGRGIDLSQRAAEQIGLNHRGVARVSITRLDVTASASPKRAAPQQWSGKASVSHYTPRQHHRSRRSTHHYQYASASTSRSHRMVTNPVGEWLLQMVR
jgi:rare lipoprotein A